MVIATSASIEVVSRESFARRLEGIRHEKSSTSSSSSMLLSSSSTASSSSAVACVNCHKERGNCQDSGASSSGSSGNGKRKSLCRHKTKAGPGNLTNHNSRNRKKSQIQHQSTITHAVSKTTPATDSCSSVSSDGSVAINIRDSLLRSRKQRAAEEFRQSSLDADSDASSSRSTTDDDIWPHKTIGAANRSMFAVPAGTAPSSRINRHGTKNRRRNEDDLFLNETSPSSLSEELSSSPEVASYLQNHYSHLTRSRPRSSKSDRYKKCTRGSHSNNSKGHGGHNKRPHPPSKSQHYYGGLYPNFHNQQVATEAKVSWAATSSSRKDWTAIISEIEKGQRTTQSNDIDVNLAGHASAPAKRYYSDLLNNSKINKDGYHSDALKVGESLNNTQSSLSSIKCDGSKEVDIKKRNVAECENVDLICNDLYTSNEKLSEESTDDSDTSDKASILSSSDILSDDSGGSGASSIATSRNSRSVRKYERKFSAEQLQDLAEYTIGAPLVQFDCHPTQCAICMHAITSYPFCYSYLEAHESNQASGFLYDLHAHHQMYQHHHQAAQQQNHHHRFFPNRQRQFNHYNHQMPYHHQHRQFFSNDHLRQYRYLYPVQVHNHWIIERPSGTRDKLSSSSSSTDGSHRGDNLADSDGKADDNVMANGRSSASPSLSSGLSSLSSSTSSLLLSPPTSPPLPPSPPAMITTSSNTVVTVCSKSPGKFFPSTALPCPSPCSKQRSPSHSEDSELDVEGRGLQSSTKVRGENLVSAQLCNQHGCCKSDGCEHINVEDNKTGESPKTATAIASSAVTHQHCTKTTNDATGTTTTKDGDGLLLLQNHRKSKSTRHKNGQQQTSSSSPSLDDGDAHKDCNVSNSVLMDLTGMDVSFSVHYPGDPAHLCLTSGSNNIWNSQVSRSLMPSPMLPPSVSYNPLHLHNHNDRNKNKRAPSSASFSPLTMHPTLSSPSRNHHSFQKDLHEKLSSQNGLSLNLSAADDNESGPHSYDIEVPCSRPWITTGQVDPDVPAACFSVMCYNVLSDKLCTKQMYGYCPTWALAWDYRKKGIMNDIITGNADIITLQEVETEQYYGLFLPELAKRGYDGVFLPKSRVRTMNSDKEKMSVDGCAIFYKKTKFEKVNEHHVEFNQLATKDGASNTDSDMINRVSTKDNIAIVAMLRTKAAAYEQSPVAPPKGFSQMLMVSTAHIHWDPQLPDVKLVQTIMLVEELRKFIKEASVQFRPNAPPPSMDSTDMCSSLPLILCGDFNSLPDSGVFEFLSKGKLNTRHRDFDGQNYKAFMKDRNENGILNHNFKLTSAYKNVIPFTNYTFDFKGVIDYIFYSGQHFKLHGVMGLQDESWFKVNKIVGCPHPFIPSDHFPLYAEFSLPAKPSQKPSSNAAPR